MALDKKWSNRLISDLMRDYGLSKNQAIGFVGPLAMESKGFTDFQEDKPVVPGSRGGGGMAQWTGPRRRAFEAHAKKNGFDDLNSYEAQYSYLKAELNGEGRHDGGIIKKLKKATSVEKAASLTTKVFLRPGVVNATARSDWTKQVQKNFVPTPGADIGGVATELDVDPDSLPSSPLSSNGRKRPAYLSDGPLEPTEPLWRRFARQSIADRNPGMSQAEQAAVLTRATSGMAQTPAKPAAPERNPGFLGTVLEQAGLLPSLASTVKPLNLPIDQKKPTPAVKAAAKSTGTPGAKASGSGSVSIQPRQAAPAVKPVAKPAAKQPVTIQTGTYRLPNVSEMAIKGSVPNVNRSDEEFTRSVLNGYREIQHMGPSSKGAPAKKVAPTPAKAAVQKSPSGATKTVGPAQQPIPPGVRPQVNVAGVDMNRRVTDSVTSKPKAPVKGLIQLKSPAKVAATSLLQAGLVSQPMAAAAVGGDIIQGLKAPTPLSRIAGDTARAKAAAAKPRAATPAPKAVAKSPAKVSVKTPAPKRNTPTHDNAGNSMDHMPRSYANNPRNSNGGY